MVANTVYVRNLAHCTDSETLGREFFRFGAIHSVRIMKGFNGRENVSLNYGFVGFKSPEGAQAALAWQDPIVVDGRTLVLELAPPPPRRKRDTAFVLGIPAGTTSDDLKRAFAAYNPTEARIVHEGDGDRQKGFAFVTFATEDDQTKAVCDNRAGIAIGSGTSQVLFARPMGDL